MSESEDVIKTLTGRGFASAPGCPPVRIRYRLLVVQRPEGMAIVGTLTGRHVGLRPIWLEPDATLRLRGGRTLAISVTDLIGDVAEFEGTGAVPDL